MSDTYDYEKSKLEKVKNNEGLDLLFLKYANDCKNLVDEELKKNFNFNFNFFYKSKAEWYVYLLNLKMRKIYLKKLLILKKKYQDVISYVKNFLIEEETVIWIVLFLSELLKKYESQNQ